MEATGYIKPDIGMVSRYLQVCEIVVRTVPRHDLYPELDGTWKEETCDVSSTHCIQYEDRLQGRLVNASKSKLSCIKYDLSYYDESGAFLGLDKSRFLEEDELDVDDHLPIDLKVCLPDQTAKCVFNARAKVPGRLGRIFWG